MRVLSLGAGVQSSTLLLMAVHGEIQIDRAILADTQDETPETYDWLETMMPLAERAGIPVDVVSKGHLGETVLSGKRGSIIPLFVLQPDGKTAPIMRQCTRDFKIRVIRKRAQEIAGGEHVAMVQGISLDEVERMSMSQVPWATNEYPLVDRRMSRWDCELWLTQRGYPVPPKSACYYCPLAGNRRWREMRDQQPANWDRAVAFDHAIRTLNPKLKGPAFLHRSGKPLDQVDLSTQQDAGQMDLFGEDCSGPCGL